MPRVLIPTPLRKFTSNKAEVDLKGDTIIAAFQDLVEQYPAIENYLLDGEVVKPFIKVFKGNDDIESLQSERTAVADDETISIIPAIAGGKK